MVSDRKAVKSDALVPPQVAVQGIRKAVLLLGAVGTAPGVIETAAKGPNRDLNDRLNLVEAAGHIVGTLNLKKPRNLSSWSSGPNKYTCLEQDGSPEGSNISNTVPALLPK